MEEEKFGNPFRGIWVPKNPQELLDIAFRRATRISAPSKQKMSAIKRKKSLAITRIRALFTELSERLWNIVRFFPNLDELHPFYASVMEIYCKKDDVKIALAKIKSSALLIERLGKEYIIKIKAVRKEDELTPTAKILREIDKLRVEAYGRISSVVKKLKKEFSMLNDLVRKLAKLPDFDPRLPILVVAGPTNAGKSTFVKTVSNAKVEVANYPFTTKNVTFGVMKWKLNPALDAYLQVVDTPGLLDRPLEKRKPEEKLALKALQTLPNAVLFLFDGSTDAVCSAKEQINIFNTVTSFFDMSKIKLFVAINKIDIVEKEILEEILHFVSKNGIRAYKMSLITKEGVNKLLEDIKKEMAEVYLRVFERK